MATLFAPPYKARRYLRHFNRQGYISPYTTIYHSHLTLGEDVFIGDGAILFEGDGGGSIELGQHVSIWGDALLETGDGGRLVIGDHSRIQRGVQLIACKQPIIVGRDVGFSANVAVHSYNHGIVADIPYIKQPLESRGPVIIGDHSWIGVNAVVLSGVRIGQHAVIGAGSVVTQDVPDGAIVTGRPARVIKFRSTAGAAS